MYVPKPFEETDWPAVAAFVREFSFGLLVTTGPDGLPTATHLPLDLVEHAGAPPTLRGHLARANPQWKHFGERPALAVFAEPHAYVSSSWYNHVNVPTWNYLAVHAYGPVRVVEGDELVGQMRQQVARYETGRANAFALEKFSEKELQQHLRGLVGFEMTLETIQAKAKLSQNRDDESYRNVMARLRESDDSAARRVAGEMEKRRPRPS